MLIFFVLSGYVLVRAYLNEQAYRSFVIRRIARLYPPFFAVTLLSIFLYHQAAGVVVPDASRWLAALWAQRVTITDVIGHLLLLDTPEFNSVNPVVWTLAHELRIALVFPLIVWALLRDTRRTLFWSVIASVAAHGLSLWTPVEIDTWLMTIHYALLFTAGAAVAIHDGQVRTFMGRLSRGTWAIAWIAALTLLALPIANWSTFYFGGPAAVAALVLCANDPTARRLLSKRLPVWFGRISYSLYLVHLPVMLAAIHLGAGLAPVPLLLALAAGASIALAWAGHRFIERPAQRWGRRPSAPRPALVAAE